MSRDIAVNIIAVAVPAVGKAADLNGVADILITLPTSNEVIDRVAGNIAKYLTGTYTMVLKIWD